jgi:dipeptidyl aminopeptidase/acylaminoacyl peptidase
MRLQSFMFLVPLALLFAPPSTQQQPPATEVYVRPLQGTSSWLNISNSPGYDNQPSFLPDSSAVLFSSNRDGKQTDIYRYDIASRVLTQLTKTVDSEYSPLVTPDGKGFSVIRQAAADSTQLLVRYDLDGSNARVLLEDVKPVGYHAWIDATHVALYILGGQGQPATLQIADTTTGKAEIVATGIGRSILIRPGGTVSFITTGQGRWVKEWDPKTRQIAAIFEPLENSQDAAWTDRNTLLMASGTAITEIRRSENAAVPGIMINGKRFTFTSDPADPKSPPVANITRLAVSPNGQWLAFVAEPVRTTPGVVLTNEKERLPESFWDRR